MEDKKKEIPEGSIPSPIGASRPGDPLPPRDWNKIVANASGSRAFLPGELKKAWDELDAVVIKYNQAAKEMAKKSLRLGRMRENFWMDVREALGEKGVDIWMKEVGFDADAMKENKLVVNMWEDEKR